MRFYNRACSQVGLVLTVALIALSPASARVADANEKLTEEEREQVRALVNESRIQYLGLLAATSDAQWNWKPNETRWSVGECAEHILRSNIALFTNVGAALESPRNAEWEEKTKGKTQMILQVMPNRQPMGQGGASAPMEIRPTGALSRQEIVEQFNKLYAEIEAFLDDADAPLKSHTAEHPFPIFGTLNAHQWLVYVPTHTIRHSRQMIEVMETEGYPSM